MGRLFQDACAGEGSNRSGEAKTRAVGIPRTRDQCFQVAIDLDGIFDLPEDIVEHDRVVV